MRRRYVRRYVTRSLSSLSVRENSTFFSSVRSFTAENESRHAQLVSLCSLGSFVVWSFDVTFCVTFWRYRTAYVCLVSVCVCRCNSDAGSNACHARYSAIIDLVHCIKWVHCVLRITRGTVISVWLIKYFIKQYNVSTLIRVFCWRLMWNTSKR